MLRKFNNIVLFLALLNLFGFALAIMKLTNIQCRSLSDVAVFKECRIEAISHSLNAVSINVSLARAIDNATVSFKIMKKSNSWKKFLIERKDIDICNYLKNPKRLPFINLMYEYLKRFTNVHHKCPYDHDIFVSRMTFDENDTHLNYIPIGEYALLTTWSAYGVPAATINGYLFYTDYRKNW